MSLFQILIHSFTLAFLVCVCMCGCVLNFHSVRFRFVCIVKIIRLRLLEWFTKWNCLLALEFYCFVSSFFSCFQFNGLGKVSAVKPHARLVGHVRIQRWDASQSLSNKIFILPSVSFITKSNAIHLKYTYCWIYVWEAMKHTCLCSYDAGRKNRSSSLPHRQIYKYIHICISVIKHCNVQ